MDSVIVIIVILFIIFGLVRNIAGPGLIFTAGIIVLGVFGILTPSEMLAGFANEQIAIIVMLLILGDIIKKSNLIEMFFYKIFENSRNQKSFIARMATLTAGMSAFLNNTPLVAVMMPFVHSWAKKSKVSVSKLLIPLSYAAILGGGITLIGTSTNLVVNGLVTDQHIIPGLSPLNIFDFTPVGLTMAILGILYLVLFSNKLLPAYKDILNTNLESNREYMVEMRVRENAQIHGKTIEQAGLRNLSGLFLVALHRNNQEFRPVKPQVKIFSGDILTFAGNTNTITDVVENHKDIQLAEAGMYEKLNHSEMMEVVISYNSSLVGKTPKKFNFRSKYDAAIVAIHRNGVRLSGKIGEIVFETGDVLMLIAGDDFHKRSFDNKDFHIINKIKEFSQIDYWRSYVFIIGLFSAIILAGIGLVPLFTSLLFLIVILNLVGIASPREIAKGIDFNLVFVIALSLALGTAMVKTGLAESFAQSTFNFLKPLGIVGILTGIFIFTNLLASLITNKASVALVFPIVLTMALDLNMDPKPFILIIAFAGAASFITPIGYQTNLMVYGPGGYKFKDFLKIGAPLTFLYMIVTIAILIWQFDLSLY